MSKARFRFLWLTLAAVLVAAGPVPAADPPAEKPAGPQAGKLVRETWYAAYVNDIRAGYVYFSVREITRPDGMTFLRAAKELHLTLKRGGNTARVEAVTGTDELAEGRVLGVFMRQGLGKEQALLMHGFVRGDKLQVKVVGKDETDVKLEKQVPWDAQVVGHNREEDLVKDRKAKPGDEFSYSFFDPTLTAVVRVQVAVKDAESVKGPGLRSNNGKKLLRVEAMPEKIEDTQLPLSIMWFDPDSLELAYSQQMLPIGKLNLVRSTKELCTAPVTESQPDLMSIQSVRLRHRILDPHQSAMVIYRVTLPDDDKPETAFARDERQEVQPLKNRQIELTVKAVREPGKDAGAAPAGKEYTESNYFINSDNARVKELAKRAVGKEADPWAKAVKVEKWVHTNMKPAVYDEAMATADHVARTLSGDCTEFAMLTAAMCRAAGVPSRTAIGLIYVDDLRAPTLAYHMWTEVYVRGRWVALDATLGEGGIGAAHVKITDHSWHDTNSFKPLLPVMRVLIAKPAVEVVGVQPGK